MVRIPLNDQWMRKLLDLPESGMGYQRVDVVLKDGRMVRDAVALNAQVLQVPDDLAQFSAADIQALELSTGTHP